MKKRMVLIILAVTVSFIFLTDSNNKKEVYIEDTVSIRDDLFTQEELKWIEENKNKELIVGLAKDYVPIEYLDKEYNPKGLGIEVLRNIHKITGLKLKIYDNILDETWDDMIHHLYDGTIDLLPAASYTEKREEKICFSKPYLETTLVIVGHKDNAKIGNNLDAVKDKTFVAAKGYWIVDTVLKENPDMNIFLVQNAKEALKYINNKKAEYTICEIPIFTYYKEQGIYKNIKIVGEVKDKNTIMVGVRKGLEPLVGIINKTIDDINTNELYEKALVMPKTNYKEKKLMSTILILSIILFIAVYYLYHTFKRLVEAKKEAEEAYKQKTKFMTDISHDLRTPVTIILGYTQAIIDGQVKEQADKEKYINRIYKKTQYLNALINDFFLVARLEDNKVTFVKQEMDIHQLIRNIVADMDIKFQSKNINVVLNLDQKTKIIKNVDKVKMYRAIENIISNSIKYSTQNGTIEIGTTLLEKDKIQLYIKDYGIGINKEDIPYLFDRYYKGKNKTTKEESIGLGLFITKEIIEKHDGNIWVESEPSQGSVFYISM